MSLDFGSAIREWWPVLLVQVLSTAVITQLWIRLLGGRALGTVLGFLAGAAVVASLDAAGAPPFHGYSAGHWNPFRSKDVTAVAVFLYSPLLPAILIAWLVPGPRGTPDGRLGPLADSFQSRLVRWWSLKRLRYLYFLAVLLFLLDLWWFYVPRGRPTWWDAAHVPLASFLGISVLPSLTFLAALALLVMELRRKVPVRIERARLYGATLDVVLARAARRGRTWVIASAYLLIGLAMVAESIRVGEDHALACMDCGRYQFVYVRYGARRAEFHPGPCTPWYARRVGRDHECRWELAGDVHHRNVWGREVLSQYPGPSTAGMGIRALKPALETLERQGLDLEYYRYLAHPNRDVARLAAGTAYRFPDRGTDDAVRAWWEQTRRLLDAEESKRRP